MRPTWRIYFLGSLLFMAAGCGRKKDEENQEPAAASPALARAITLKPEEAARIGLKVKPAKIINLGHPLTLSGSLDYDRNASAGPDLDLHRLTAYLDLYDSTVLGQMHVGEMITLRNPQRPLNPMKGRITSISPQVDPQTGAIVLRVSVKNPDEVLKPGMPVTAYLELPGSEKGIAVPQEAVVFDSQGGAWMYIQEKSDSFIRQPVEISFLGGGRLAIQRGLQEGQIYVTVGAQDLFSQEFSGQIDTGD